MTFDASAHPRDTTGQFAEKVGASPEVTLSDDFAVDKLAAKVTRASNRHGDKRYHVTDGDFALVEELTTALREPSANQALVDASGLFAERLEDANFHSACRRIDAAAGEALHRMNPDAQVHNPSAVMQASENMELVRRAADEYNARLTETYISNGNTPEAAESMARERTDNNLVYNPKLDESLARELHGRVTGWRRDELLANPSLPADLR